MAPSNWSWQRLNGWGLLLLFLSVLGYIGKPVLFCIQAVYSWFLKGRDNAIGIGWCSNHVDFITRVIDVGFWIIWNTHHLQICTDAVSYWAIWPMNCWNNIAPHNTPPCITKTSSTQQHSTNGKQGPDSMRRCCLTSIGNPTVEIRRSYDRLISTMGFPILEKWHLYIESRPGRAFPTDPWMTWPEAIFPTTPIYEILWVLCVWRTRVSLNLPANDWYIFTEELSILIIKLGSM